MIAGSTKCGPRSGRGEPPTSSSPPWSRACSMACSIWYTARSVTSGPRRVPSSKGSPRGIVLYALSRRSAQGVDDGFVDDDAAGAGAALSGCAHSPEEDAARGQVQID